MMVHYLFLPYKFLTSFLTTKGFSWTYRKIRELRGDKTALPAPRAPMTLLISRFFPSGSDSTRPEAPKVKPGDYETLECSPFSQEEARAVFSSLKRTNSAGPDSISNNMLLHLGPQMILVLLRIANWSSKTRYPPRVFQKGKRHSFSQRQWKRPLRTFFVPPYFNDFYCCKIH